MPEEGSSVKTPNDPGLLPFKGNLGVPQGKENLTLPVGFLTMTSGLLDLLMLYQLSYEASMGTSPGNLGSESR